MACWYEDDDEFYNCPFLFIPITILEWFEEYSYYKEFQGTAPTYWQQGSKWIEVAAIYNSYFNQYQLEAVKKQQVKNQTIVKPRTIDS